MATHRFCYIFTTASGIIQRHHLKVVSPRILQIVNLSNYFYPGCRTFTEDLRNRNASL